MCEKNNVQKLKDKVESFFSNQIVTNTLRLSPKIDDAMEYVTRISNIADNFKLEQAWRCISEDKDIETSINILYNYVSNQDRAFYISDTFKRVILSNSKIASAIIAYMLGEISRSNRDFTQEDIILYNALSNMTDYDINNFVYIMDKMIGNRVGTEYIDMGKCKGDNANIWLTINLCVSYRIFSQESSVLNNGIMYTGTHTKITKQSYTLRSYIEKTKQLLGYA